MTGNIIARRYAKALFSLGLGQGGDAVAAYGKDLDALAAVLEKAPELMRVFANPIFVVAEKKAVLDGVLADLSISPMVKNFLGLLAEKERLGYLPDIAAYYRTLLDESQGAGWSPPWGSPRLVRTKSKPSSRPRPARSWFWTSPWTRTSWAAWCSRSATRFWTRAFAPNCRY